MSGTTQKFPSLEIEYPHNIDQFIRSITDVPAENSLDVQIMEQLLLNSEGARNTQIFLNRYRDKQTYTAIAETAGVSVPRVREIIAALLRQLIRLSRDPVMYLAPNSAHQKPSDSERLEILLPALGMSRRFTRVLCNSGLHTVSLFRDFVTKGGEPQSIIHFGPSYQSEYDKLLTHLQLDVHPQAARTNVFG